FFEEAALLCGKPLEAANLVANDLRRELAAAGTEGIGPLPLEDCKLTPGHIAELVSLVDAGTISKQIARDIFPEIFATGERPAALIERKGPKETSDSGERERLAREAIANDPATVEKVKAGNDKAINALKGPIMKATKGKADPKAVD